MKMDEKIDEQQQSISPKNPLRNHTNNNQQQPPQPGEPPQQQPEMDSQNAAEKPKEMVQQEDEDIYKREGQILFKIEKLNGFARSPNETRRVQIGACRADNPDPGWSCARTAKLKVLSRKEGKGVHSRQISHVYNAKANDWGFSNFLSFEQQF